VLEVLAQCTFRLHGTAERAVGLTQIVEHDGISALRERVLEVLRRAREVTATTGSHTAIEMLPRRNDRRVVGMRDREPQTPSQREQDGQRAPRNASR
jgi:hypothetical protein